MRANCSSPPQITGSHSLGRINSGAVGPEATEDLLPQFHHPTIAFREIVGEGHTQIGEKAQYILFADTQAQQSGGPDRRFGDNRQLPVCLYDVMHLSSNSGVNELMEFSRTGFVQPFSMALHELPRK